MEHYVTLFDSLFLPQGLALHRSMERHIENYTLWILCVDDVAYSVLFKLKLSNINLLKLSDLETDELKKVKTERTKGEYCWTLTPFAPKFVFEADQQVDRVTYLDADLWFRKNPRLIFEEFEASKKQVLITDHAYAPEYDQSETSGQYCVQFMVLSRSAGGEKVRQWWADRCIEWCYARVEEGKFGDQKYLDDWPERFKKEVHVLQDKELLLAPWNASRLPYGRSVVYHFHGLRLLKNKRILSGIGYNIPNVVFNAIYRIYFNDFKEAMRSLESINHKILIQSDRNILFFLKIYVFRKIQSIRKINQKIVEC